MYKFELNDPKFLPHIGCKIQLSLAEGDGMVLVGHNGIGKTTLMRRICQDYKSKIPMSFVEQGPLDFFFDRSLGDIKSILLNSRRELINLEILNRSWQALGLLEKEDRRSSSLSGGEAQALKLCLGLGCKSALYLLDEPTQSLDKERKLALGRLLSEMRREGTTFLVIEHDLDWPGPAWKVQSLEIEEQQLVRRKSWTT